ncbi:UNVERIFIED_CONTAM: hypothetical protein Cloal_0391 [Acetivibrio alkalicellulosi]
MILFLIGFIAGIVSGMGIGGGAILIPALIMFVKPPQHIAQSVNLLYFIPTAIVALVIHIKNKRINFKLALPIIIFGLFGAYIGSQLALNLSGPVLRKWFGVFLLAIGINEMLRKTKDRKGTQ